MRQDQALVLGLNVQKDPAISARVLRIHFWRWSLLSALSRALALSCKRLLKQDFIVRSVQTLGRLRLQPILEAREVRNEMTLLKARRVDRLFYFYKSFTFGTGQAARIFHELVAIDTVSGT